MGFLFGEPKLSTEEFNRCLVYLGEHYKLTTFQEKEADIYNGAVTRYSPTLDVGSNSAKEMLKVAERYKKAAHLLIKRSKQLVSVPDTAGTLHFAWQVVFSSYVALVDAQHAVYATIVDGNIPRIERVQTIFHEHQEFHKKALKEEERLLKRLRSSGLTPSDVQSLTDKAFADVETENWQPGGRVESNIIGTLKLEPEAPTVLAKGGLSIPIERIKEQTATRSVTINYCSKCGHKLSEKMSYCPKCGRKIR